MTSSTLVKLSRSAKEAGGELVRIMDNPLELKRYTADGIDLSPINHRKVSDIVVANPSLNTEEGVGGLLWLASFHKESIDKWLNTMMSTYPNDKVLLSIEFMYEVGVRGGQSSSGSNTAGRRHIQPLIDFMLTYEDATGTEIIDADMLYSIVHFFGGLESACDFDTVERIRDRINQQDSLEV